MEHNDWDIIWDIDPAGEYPTIHTNDMGDEDGSRIRLHT